VLKRLRTESGWIESFKQENGEIFESLIRWRWDAVVPVSHLYAACHLHSLKTHGSIISQCGLPATSFELEGSLPAESMPTGFRGRDYQTYRGLVGELFARFGC